MSLRASTMAPEEARVFRLGKLDRAKAWLAD
jgi:hypothetical protein